MTDPYDWNFLSSSAKHSFCIVQALYLKQRPCLQTNERMNESANQWLNQLSNIQNSRVTLSDPENWGYTMLLKCRTCGLRSGGSKELCSWGTSIATFPPKRRLTFRRDRALHNFDLSVPVGCFLTCYRLSLASALSLLLPFPNFLHILLLSLSHILPPHSSLVFPLIFVLSLLPFTFHSHLHSPHNLSSVSFFYDRLCGLVVGVLGYRSGGSGSIPKTTTFSEK
jgi:hypothetical protein